MSETTIKASCLCGSSNFSTSVPISSLPIRRKICHCNSCRHGTGTLAYSALDWPGDFPSTDTMTKFPFSKDVDSYFCTTCGAHMLWWHHGQNELSVTPGVLADPDKVMNVVAHIFLGDTLDGGCSIWLPTYNDKEIPRFLEGEHKSEQLPADWRSKNSVQDSKATHLRAHCLCEGIDFYIQRPDDESVKKTADPNPWWVTKDKRYLGSNDVCDSCRLTSGLEIQQWTFAPLSFLSHPNGELYSLDAGTLKGYNSSEGTMRYFCGRCGAVVFYWCEDRPDLVDIAVGLLDSPSGARAEDWLQWEPRIVWKQDMKHKRLLDSLEKGLQRWQELTGAQSVKK